jgi:hypothetical protein
VEFHQIFKWWKKYTFKYFIKIIVKLMNINCFALLIHVY